SIRPERVGEGVGVVRVLAPPHGADWPQSISTRREQPDTGRKDSSKAEVRNGQRDKRTERRQAHAHAQVSCRALTTSGGSRSTTRDLGPTKTWLSANIDRSLAEDA